MDAKIKFLKPFKDGNISSEPFKMFQVVIVSNNVLQRLKNSGAEIEIIERIVPPSSLADDSEEKTKRPYNKK